MVDFELIENTAFELLRIFYQDGTKVIELLSKLSTSEEKLLLKSIVLTWQNTNEGAFQLEELGKDGIIWGYILLANFYCDTNHINSAKITLSCAENLMFLLNQPKSLTNKYLLLIKARFDIISGLPEQASKIINSILVDKKNHPLVDLLAKYLLALTFKQTQDITNFSKTINETLELSASQGYSFIQGLCLVERRLLLTDNPPLMVNTLQEALNIFRSLGANLHENEVKSHLCQIDSTLSKAFYNVDGYLFLSPKMKTLRGDIAELLASANPTPAMILGPTGAGKSSIAKVIHKLSGRKGHFVDINCSTIPEGLIESELFGHEKGSFTGSQKTRIGMLEMANNGTIFLDEITETPKSFQTKLLKVIEDKSFRSVGDSKVKKVDVLFIAATNKPLDTIFNFLREDLFYRFPCTLVLPGLNERREEILMLAKEFLRRYGDGKEYILTPETEALLLKKSYQGNIRGLENNIRNAINKANNEKIQYIKPYMIVDTLSDKVSMNGSNNHKITLDISEVGFDETINQCSREIILYVLKMFDNNIKQAREFLKLNERTFRRYLQVFDLRSEKH
jgi:DNA-binding NtrC family response regulator